MENSEKPTDERVEEIKRQAEARTAEVEAVKIALNTAGSNENVRIILRFLMKMSGFHGNGIVMGPNKDVLVSSVIYNVGYEGLYQDLRKLMSAETKNLVERSE